MTDADGRCRRAVGRVLPLREWARLGAQSPEGHLETDYLARGATEDEARAASARCRSATCKALLDALIAERMAARRRAAGGTRCATKAPTGDATRDANRRRRATASSLSGTGGVWQVRTDDGETVEASLRGRLKKSNSGKRADGSLRRDTISAAAEHAQARGRRRRACSSRATRGDAWAIAEILPRRSQLARRAPGGGQGERIVAANVDQVVVMFAAAKPEPHPRMLDRFLVIAEGNDLAARIIINKVDLVGEDAARARFDDYERAGYPVHYTSVKAGVGLEALRDALDGRRSVLTGPSGVGKSSLLNALFPGANLRVGAISESVNKGRHTTVGALMLPLPGDAMAATSSTRRGCARSDSGPCRSNSSIECFPEMRALQRRVPVRATAATSPSRTVPCEPRFASGGISAQRYDSYLQAARGDPERAVGRRESS